MLALSPELAPHWRDQQETMSNWPERWGKSQERGGQPKRGGLEKWGQPRRGGLEKWGQPVGCSV